MAGELYDAPNQQCVGLDPPWVEGTGGSGGEVQPVDEETGEPDDDEEPEPANLDAMTKAELLDEAERRGVDVDPTATKAEVREALG